MNSKHKLRKIQQEFGRFKSKGVIPEYVVSNPDNEEIESQTFSTILPSLTSLQDTFENPNVLKIQIIDSTTKSTLETEFITMVEEDEGEIMQESAIDKRLNVLESSNAKLIDAVTKILERMEQSSQSKKNPLEEIEAYIRFANLINKDKPQKDPNSDVNAKLSELFMKAYLDQQSMDQMMKGLSEVLKIPAVNMLLAPKASSMKSFPLGKDESSYSGDDFNSFLKQMNQNL